MKKKNRTIALLIITSVFGLSGLGWFVANTQNALKEEMSKLREKALHDSLSIQALLQERSEFLVVLDEYLGFNISEESQNSDAIRLLDTALKNDRYHKQELKGKLEDNLRRIQFLNQFNQLLSEEKINDLDKFISLSNELDLVQCISDSVLNELNTLKEELARTSLDSMTLISPLGDRLFFYGRIKDGQPNGFGIGFYSGKGYYIGEYEGNKRNGRGKHFYKNGDWYDGEFSSDARHGFGIYVFSSGDKYSGHWKEDLMNGTGEMITSEGERIKGVWAKGKMIQTD